MSKMRSRIEDIIEKFDELEGKLLEVSDPKELVKLSKERAAIEAVVSEGRRYIGKLDALVSLQELLKTESDKEMIPMIKDEIGELKDEIPKLEDELKVLLIPKDLADDNNAIIEIRAGTGGDEAGIFAGDLLKMYQRFADASGWKFEIIDANSADAGGVKEAIINVSGHGVYGKMRFESGTHRVQRIPVTETQGRVHTSAATVAVFPEVSEVEVELKPADLKVDVFRSSGAGGQHVNTTESAVRITHLPTGIVVVIQDGRSQLKNREKAMSVLRSKVYEHEEQKRQAEISSNRKQQVGSGDRSEKIRTYNFPQNRLTDHRIGFTSYNLDKVIGEGRIADLIEALRVDHQTKLVLDGDV